MLKKETILKTAICYWSEEDKCYVVESPFFAPVIAAEKTPEKAFRTYQKMLDSAYEELLKNNVHGFRKGRPAKHGVELHIQIQPDTKQLVDELRKDLGLSQGEFIDLSTFYFAKKAQALPAKSHLSAETTINDLFKMVQAQKSFA